MSCLVRPWAAAYLRRAEAPSVGGRTAATATDLQAAEEAMPRAAGRSADRIPLMVAGVCEREGAVSGKKTAACVFVTRFPALLSVSWLNSYFEVTYGFFHTKKKEVNT